MAWMARRRDATAAVVGLVLPVGVALTLVPFRATFANTAAALVLVAAVTAVATLGSRAGGYVAAVSAALSFDLLLTRPYGSLTITRSSDLEIAVSLLVVGVLVTELAARSRRNALRAERQATYVTRIREASELAAEGVPRSEVIEAVRAELVDLLALRGCRFERGQELDPLAELGRDGHVTHGGFDWPVDRWGLPGARLALPVLHRGRQVGRFVLEPTRGRPVPLQQRMVAVTLADQVGSVLGRHLHVA